MNKDNALSNLMDDVCRAHITVRDPSTDTRLTDGEVLLAVLLSAATIEAAGIWEDDGHRDIVVLALATLAARFHKGLLADFTGGHTSSDQRDLETAAGLPLEMLRLLGQILGLRFAPRAEN